MTDVVGLRAKMCSFQIYDPASGETKETEKVNSVRKAIINALFFIHGLEVPQVSALRPLLFNVDVSGLCNAVSTVMLALYADDTTVVVKSGRRTITFVPKVGDAVGDIAKWFRASRLKVNYKKSSFVVFGRKTFCD
jgi:hypothetical protein